MDFKDFGGFENVCGIARFNSGRSQYLVHALAVQGLLLE